VEGCGITDDDFSSIRERGPSWTKLNPLGDDRAFIARTAMTDAWGTFLAATQAFPGGPKNLDPIRPPH
jgi:hypothetical protein